jgi:hypothetical protein
VAPGRAPTTGTGWSALSNGPRAVRGTDKCRNHSGIRTEIQKVQGEARITAFNPHGSGATLDAGAAVLSVLQMTYLRLGTYSELLRRQVVKDGEVADDYQDDMFAPDASGLIGHRYGMGGKDGITYVQTEEVRALVVLEAAERDRVVKYAKTAHDMGISERLTSLAETWMDVVAGRVVAMLDALGLTPEQQAMVPTLIEAHLGSIDIESGPAITDGKS